MTSEITLNNVQVYADVNVDVNEVLGLIDSDTLIRYVETELHYSPDIEPSGFFEDAAKDGSLIDYITEQYHRGSFSSIDFKQLFDKMGIKG